MSTLKFLKLDGRMALELILFEYQACYYNQSLVIA